ncbi:MAG: molybdenum cofactor biosynthesis protein MoaE [Parafilimonas terrae]|nr:molybdenum cofactor biosynthesis protein MoaE [Parafilimonas terrae]
MARVSVQAEDIDVAAEISAAVHDRTDLGAVVTFTGVCRDEGGTLAALEIEHYPGMAEAEIARIAATAETRWDLGTCRVIHRYGVLKPGEVIVLVVTASRHRKDAFSAAEFLMDYLKTDAPFWKKTRPTDRSAGRWIDARAQDSAAVERWR